MTSPHGDLGGRAGELVAAARAALGGDEAGLLQVLEDLLEEARRDQLALGDLADLCRAAVVVEGDVEQRPHSVAAFVGQLHARGYAFSHRESQYGRASGFGRDRSRSSEYPRPSAWTEDS